MQTNMEMFFDVKIKITKLRKIKCVKEFKKKK